MMPDTHVMTTIVDGWTVDDDGILRTPSGAKACRIAGRVLYFWDKRAGCERPLTLTDLQRCMSETGAESRE
jgi:hypothetical protein